MSEVVWVETHDEFLEHISEGRVVVDFSAPAWCQPCIKFAPIYDRVASEVEDVKFLAVDIDNAPWATSEYQIRSVPTVMLFEDGAYVRNLKTGPALAFKNQLEG